MTQAKVLYSLSVGMLLASCALDGGESAASGEAAGETAFSPGDALLAADAAVPSIVGEARGALSLQSAVGTRSAASGHMPSGVGGQLGFGERATFDALGVVIPLPGTDRSGVDETASLRISTRSFGRSDTQVSSSAVQFQEDVCAADGVSTLLGDAHPCAGIAWADRGNGLIEWWEGHESALQQGWILASAPAGEGPLRLEVAVEGISVAVEADGTRATFGSGDGRFDYSGLVAYDADGTSLEAWLEPADGGLAIRVSDINATYPITIDPWVTTATWSVESNASSYLLGWDVLAVGDATGDGFDDVAVGARGYSSNTGAVYFFSGSSAGLGTSYTTLLTGEATSDYFGTSVTSGDIDNDGYPDLIVGAPGYTSDDGAYYYYEGSSSGYSSRSRTAYTSGNYDYGAALATADVNGDLYDDLVIGAPGYSTERGFAVVRMGSSSGLSSTTYTVYGAASSNYFGNTVANAGDVNKDGYEDVIVGAYGYTSNTGRAYLYKGSAAGLDTTVATTLTGGTTSNYFGFDVAGAGDVNNDGYDDVLVGAYGYSSSTGQVTVYHGSSTGLDSTASTTLTGSASGEQFGYSVRGIGDIDFDGYDDVIVGAPGATSSTGKAYLFMGSATGLSTTAAATLTGAATSDYFGFSVAGAGDVDGDNRNEVVVGAAYYGSTNEGKAYVYNYTNGTVTLTSPNGGESLAGGSVHSITWTTADINGATSIDVYYSTDGGSTYADTIATGLAPTDTSYAWTVPALGSSTIRVKVIVRATAGDNAEASASNFTIDSTAPGTFDLVSPTNGAYGPSLQVFDWATSTGVSTYQLWVDGVLHKSGITSSTYTLTSAEPLAAGNHVWYVKALDAALNATQSTSTWTVATETTGPSAFALTSPADATWQPETASLVWDASADTSSGLSSYRVYVDATACSSVLSPTTTSLLISSLTCTLAEGMHTWYVVATDAVGNTTQSDPVGGWTFGLDTLGAGQLSAWDGKVYDTDEAVSDGRSTTLVAVVGDELRVSASGTWYMGSSCTSGGDDANGDSSSSSGKNVSGCAYGSLVGGTSTSSSTWFCVGSSEDRVMTSAGTVQFGANDDDASNCSTGYLSVVAGLYSSWTPTAPTTASSTSDNTPTFTWPAITDSGSGLASYSVIAGSSTIGSGITTTSFTPTTALADANYTWYVQAVDAVGLTRDSTSLTVRVDTTAPAAFSLTSPVDSDCSALSTPTFTWAASSDSGAGLETYTLYVDDVATTTVASTITSATPYLADGTHTWYVTATDKAGNVRASTQTYSVAVGTATEVCDGVDNDCNGDWFDADVDEVPGGTASTGATRLRGNKVKITDPTSLSSLQAYLSVSSGTVLRWSVYESATETGTFTRVVTADRTETATSLGWKTSPPLPWVLRRDYYYAFAVSWSTSTTDYENATATLPLTLSIGDLKGGVSASVSTPATTATFSTLTTTVQMRIVTGGEADADGDGVVLCDGDCDDTDETIFPGATEICNGYDDNCDDVVPTDESDVDSDGVSECDGDCDDLVDTVYPSATEACDGVDSDCDGVVESTELDGDADGYSACEGDCDDADSLRGLDAVETTADGIDQDCDLVDDCYVDTDGDNYGVATTGPGSSLDCAAGSGAAVSTDCDDSRPTISPAGTEACDEANLDEDCDGSADDNDPGATGQTAFYADGDGDGYGVGVSALWCDAPTGWVSNATDCDDGTATISPVGTELVGDGIDQDCDLVDSCYQDADNDNFGVATVIDGTGLDCVVGSGAAVIGDCVDTIAAVNPGATEVVGDGIDSDCNDSEVCFVDADDDGYRDDDSVTVQGSSLGCSGVGEAAASLPSGDCDDDNASFNPSIVETTCMGPEDYDCDGVVDYDNSDRDADGFGACDECDDLDAGSYPTASEIVGDGIDEDCDGIELCFIDLDGDGYRATDDTVASSDVDCDDPDEAADTSVLGDCDDADARYNPGASESDCTDANDYNCDGSSGRSDVDGDGYAACQDCDDTSAAFSPAAAELPGDSLDQNCDGSELCFADADGDGYRPDATSTVVSADLFCNALGEAGSVVSTGDCDDTSTAYNPGIVETDCADPNDYDCDGSVAYADEDADGAAACEDCDDTDAASYPGGTEVPGDAVDGDCDGLELCFVDADNDGYRPDGNLTVSSVDIACSSEGEAADTTEVGDCDDANAAYNPGASESDCADPTDFNCDGLASDIDSDSDSYRACEDCDDRDSTINPSAAEICDPANVDEDCDGLSDDIDRSVSGLLTFYADEDEDGYGGPNSAEFCDQPAGWSTASDDCDDTNWAYHPGAEESDCTDPNDYNCDGSVALADADGDGHPACDDCNDADAAYFPGAVESDCADANDYNCDGSTGYSDADADGYAACADCDDNDAGRAPDAVEVVGSGADEDCDGIEWCYVDGDGDGYRMTDGETVESDDVACDGTGEASVEAAEGDCDDANADYSPGAVESDCTDPNDYNCDGSIGYADADADGHAACAECDDTDEEVNPDAEESCNSVDDDCNGEVDDDAVDATVWYADADGDGYSDPATTLQSCTQPAGYRPATAEDCDDLDAASYPGATEVVDDGVDQDCDGSDALGDGVPDTGRADTGGAGDGSKTPKDAEGCGCSQTGAVWPVATAAAALLLQLRRRRAA